MRRRYRLAAALCCLCLILLAAIPLTGCSREEDLEAYDYYMFYLNQDRTSIEIMGYEPESDPEDTDEMIREFIEKIRNGTDRVEYQRVYPDYVTLEDYALTGNILYVYFDKAYSDMSVGEEVLCRGAVVCTLMQIPDVAGVMFYAGDEPLCDADGQPVGLMTEESFVNNPGEEINNIQTADLTLYFASEDGRSLVSETQHVHYYSSNISMEKLVMDQLLEGPVSENAQSALPAKTNLIGVSVLDRVCFVNLDEGFLTQNYDISEEVVIYSIVNSLAELPTVERVQLSVNGETNMVYRQKMSLKEFYSMNEELVQEEGADVEVDQQENQGRENILDTGNLLDTGD